MSDSALPDGFKETEIGPIPAEWEVVPLSELATEFFSGGTPSTKTPEFWDGNIDWTTSAYIDDLYLRQGVKCITSQGLENSSTKLVPQGNLLIGTRVGVGKVAINSLDIAISQDLTAAIIDRAKANPEFLAYAVRSDGIQRVIQSRTRGTTIKGIARKDLITVPIPLPPLDEQRRIAHVLNTIQRAIAAQDDLIAAAKETKRSLMQRLFTYGPGREPASTKETEIGEIPEHWRVVKLGDIAAIERGKFSHRPRNDPRFYGGKIPFIQTGDVANSNGRITTYSQTLNERGLSVSRVFPKGTIVITIAANIGYTAILEFECAFPDSLIGITPEKSVDNVFLEYYLQTQQPEMDRMAPKGTQKNINIQFLRPWPVRKPPLSEQQEIAEMLLAADRKIEAEEQRTAALQALFKTMLHQLMTGQLRVAGSASSPELAGAQYERSEQWPY